MAYDPAVGSIVLFGGSGGCQSNYCGDTWTWDGSNWLEQSSTATPPARYVASMDFDPSSESVILFAGNDAQGNLNDTWTWEQTLPPTTAVLMPSTGAYVSGASVTFDASASASYGVGISTVQFVLTGGSNNQTVIAAAGGPSLYGYIAAWNSTSVPNGTYTLQSLVTDKVGNSTYSAGITITVANAPPSTTVILPTTGTTWQGNGAEVLDAVASPGVTQVQLEGFLVPDPNPAFTLTATLTLYGWIAVIPACSPAADCSTINPVSLPVSIQSVASYSGGVSGTSAPVDITVVAYFPNGF